MNPRTPAAHAQHAAARHLERRERLWEKRRRTLADHLTSRRAVLSRALFASPPHVVQVGLGYATFGTGLCVALLCVGVGRAQLGALVLLAAVGCWVFLWFLLAGGARRQAVAAARAELDEATATCAAFEAQVAQYRQSVHLRVAALLAAEGRDRQSS